jgi:TorA maturation chaperone TorD
MQKADNQIMPPPDVAAEEQLRMNTYSLLARLLYRPPDEPLLQLLRQIEAAPANADQLGRSWQSLRDAARQAQVAELDDEYHTLFIGVGRGELVPYGSWYQTGYLMDRPLAQLRSDLQRLGIERQADIREPEDHAAALCESMALLIQSATPIDVQQAFYKTHPGTWLQQFFTDLQTAPSARFYQAVGQLGDAFMAMEYRYLDV